MTGEDLAKPVIDFAETALGKIITSTVSWVFRGLVLSVIAFASYQFNELRTTVNNAAPKSLVDQTRSDTVKDITEAKAEVVRQQTNLWTALGSVTKSINELTTNVQVLSTRVDLQNAHNEQSIKDLKDHLDRSTPPR